MRRVIFLRARAMSSPTWSGTKFRSSSVCGSWPARVIVLSSEESFAVLRFSDAGVGFVSVR